MKDLSCTVYHHNECNNFCIKGKKANENEEMLEGKEILYQSIDYGWFSFDISIPIEKALLIKQKCKIERKKSQSNNILIIYDLQEKTEEQKIDI